MLNEDMLLPVVDMLDVTVVTFVVLVCVIVVKQLFVTFTVFVEPAPLPLTFTDVFPPQGVLVGVFVGFGVGVGVRVIMGVGVTVGVINVAAVEKTLFVAVARVVNKA